MAENENKKFFWLKLKKDFFKRHDIRIIEDMPNGKDYVLFYLKLLCESVDHEGNLRFSEQIPYNEKMLATITNTNVDIVRSAIQVFTELQLMEVLDDETIYMSEVKKMMGFETKWAQEKREYREKIKNGQSQDNVLTMSNKSKSIEIEKELEIELESHNIDACACEEEQIDNLKELIQMIEATFNRNLTNAEYITLQEFKEKGMTNESIIRDLKTYSDKTNPIAYMKKMIENAKLNYTPKPPQEQKEEKKIVRKSKWLEDFFANMKDEEEQ